MWLKLNQWRYSTCGNRQWIDSTLDAPGFSWSKFQTVVFNRTRDRFSRLLQGSKTAFRLHQMYQALRANDKNLEITPARTWVLGGHRREADDFILVVLLSRVISGSERIITILGMSEIWQVPDALSFCVHVWHVFVPYRPSERLVNALAQHYLLINYF